MTAPLQAYHSNPLDDLTPLEASASFTEDLANETEGPMLPPSIRDSSSRKRIIMRSSPQVSKKSKTSSQVIPGSQILAMNLPSSGVLSHVPLASRSPTSAVSQSSQGPPHFSSSLVTYANANPYLPMVEPRPLIMEGAASNATLAMIHSLRQKDLDVPSVSYTVKGVNFSFPGAMEGIDGAFAAKILDSIPRAEDWRFLNQFSSEELARRVVSLELQVRSFLLMLLSFYFCSLAFDGNFLL